MTQKKIHLLVIDDEENILWLLKEGLSDNRIVVHTADTSEAGYAILNRYHVDVCLVDIFLGEDNGIELVEKWAPKHPNTHFLIMTAQNTGSNVIESIKAGATDFYAKPFDLLDLKQKVMSLAGSKITHTAHEDTFSYDFQTSNKLMLDIYKLIGKIAKTNVNVLIQGDSGTGKEVIARMIHEKSTRARMPFVAINMAAIPEELLESELFGHLKGSFTGAVSDKKGKFEEADGGTIFLDEISEMDFSLQSKLLRVIQEREVTRIGSNRKITLDTRIIAATNTDLEEQVRQGKFREDLYYRLHVVSIQLPRLRERKEDIPMLVSHFLHKHRSMREHQMYASPEAISILSAYHWPGNIRELENVIQSAMVHAETDTIQPANLPEKIVDAESPQTRSSLSDELYRLAAHIVESELHADEGNAFAEYERIVEIPLLKAVLDRTGGNKSVAANVLGINRNTLRKKMKDYGLE